MKCKIQAYKRASFTLFFALLYCCVFADFAEIKKTALIEAEVVLPESSSLGGSHSTYQKGLTILFSNPALYAFAEKETTIASINFKTDTLSYSALKYIKAKDRDANLLNLLATTKSLCTNASITGPISFAFVDKNFGFGVFNTTRILAYLPSLSYFYAFAGEDLVITGGYGANVYEKDEHKIALGINMKGFLQAYSYMLGTVFGSSMRILEKKFEGLPIIFQAGFGIDLGFAYRYKDMLTLGATCKDLYTPVFVSYYDNYKDFFATKKSTPSSTYKAYLPKLNVGLSVDAFPKGHFINIYALTFYFDWRDIFSFTQGMARNYFLNFAFGTEFVFHKVLSLRFGFMELYPQVGIGLDFSYFNLDFAVYAKELSMSAWQRPMINIEIGIRFNI